MEYDKMVPFEVTTIIDMKMETKLIVETCSEYMIRNTIWRMLCGMLSGGERRIGCKHTIFTERENKWMDIRFDDGLNEEPQMGHEFVANVEG